MPHKEMSIEEIAARAGTSVAHATWSLTKTLGHVVKSVAWDSAAMAVLSVALDKQDPKSPHAKGK